MKFKKAFSAGQCFRKKIPDIKTGRAGHNELDTGVIDEIFGDGGHVVLELDFIEQKDRSPFEIKSQCLKVDLNPVIVLFFEVFSIQGIFQIKKKSASPRKERVDIFKR